MQVTKGTWGMREQCVPGSLSSSRSPAQEPGNEASAKSEGDINSTPHFATTLAEQSKDKKLRNEQVFLAVVCI